MEHASHGLSAIAEQHIVINVSKKSQFLLALVALKHTTTILCF